MCDGAWLCIASGTAERGVIRISGMAPCYRRIAAVEDDHTVSRLNRSRNSACASAGDSGTSLGVRSVLAGVPK